MQGNNRNCLSKEAGLELVELFYKSGQKQKDFCAGQNIASHVLQYWKQVHSKINANNDGKFVAATVVSASNGALKIIINTSVAIEVNHCSDLVLLKSVIEVCRLCG